MAPDMPEAEKKPDSAYASTQALTVESLLERIGGFSWFQLWASVITISPEISAAMISLSPVLTGSHQLCDNETTVIEDYAGCVNTERFPGVLKSVVQEWGLVGSNAWISDLFTSFQMCGALCGALVAGEFAERRGRKTAHFTLCLLMGVFGFGSGWAPDPYTYCILRFFAGFAVGGCYVVYLNYLMEFLVCSLLPPPIPFVILPLWTIPAWTDVYYTIGRFSTVCGCVSLWCVGEMLLALCGYLFTGWRQISWATSVPVFLIFLAYPWMPESPRWLLCHGRTEEAMEVFDQIARWNGKPTVDPSEIKAIQRSMLVGESKTRTNSITVTSLNWNNKKKGCLCRSASSVCCSFAIFKYKEYRFQLSILLFAWFTSQLIYYGISFNMKNLSGNPYLNVFYMGVVGLPGSFTGLLFNNRGNTGMITVINTMCAFLFVYCLKNDFSQEKTPTERRDSLFAQIYIIFLLLLLDDKSHGGLTKLGRKATIIGFFGISFCLLVSLITISETTNLVDEHPTIIVFLYLSVRVFVAAGFAVLSCFTAESFPTVARVSCMGICALFGNIGGILAPQFVFISTMFNSAQYITYALLSLATIIGAYNLQESTGRPLQDFLTVTDDQTEDKDKDFKAENSNDT